MAWKIEPLLIAVNGYSHPAGVDECDGSDEAPESRFDFTGERRQHVFRAALVRHMLDPGLRHHVEKLAGDMLCAANTGGPIAEPARLGARERGLNSRLYCLYALRFMEHSYQGKYPLLRMSTKRG